MKTKPFHLKSIYKNGEVLYIRFFIEAKLTEKDAGDEPFRSFGPMLGMIDRHLGSPPLAYAQDEHRSTWGVGKCTGELTSRLCELVPLKLGFATHVDPCRTPLCIPR